MALINHNPTSWNATIAWPTTGATTTTYPMVYTSSPPFTVTSYPYAGPNWGSPSAPHHLSYDFNELVDKLERKQPVVGFRAWALSAPGTLAALAQAYTWSWDVNQAACAQHHPAPHPHCGCGLYLRRNLIEVAKETSYDHVVGACLGWGRYMEHGLPGYTEGMRVEFARIIALAKPKYDPPTGYHHAPTLVAAKALLTGKPKLGKVELTAQLGKVPLIELKNLERYALEFGERM